MDDVDDTDRKAARLIASGRAFAEVAEAYGGKPAYWRTVVKSSASFKALLDECRRRIDDEFRAAATKACEVPVIDRRRYPRAPAPEPAQDSSGRAAQLAQTKAELARLAAERRESLKATEARSAPVMREVIATQLWLRPVQSEDGFSGRPRWHGRR